MAQATEGEYALAKRGVQIAGYLRELRPDFFTDN